MVSGSKESKRLPDKPSELITVALRDLKAIERSNKYIVDMNDWVVEQVDGTCAVCFAGAVMVRSCKMTEASITANRRCDKENWYKFEMLDNFRNGNIDYGLDNYLHDMKVSADVNGTIVEDKYYSIIDHHISYEESNKGFQECMKILRAILKGHSL